MNRFTGVMLFGVAAVALLLTGCADHISFADAAKYDPVGFWYGVWHGAILPIAWIDSLVDPDTAIYAIYNNGVWYNSGYMLGVSSLAIAVASINHR